MASNASFYARSFCDKFTKYVNKTVLRRNHLQSNGTRKFERGLSRLLHTELHWLDVPERVMYKLSVMMYSCLNG